MPNVSKTSKLWRVCIPVDKSELTFCANSSVCIFQQCMEFKVKGSKAFHSKCPTELILITLLNAITVF